MDTRSSKPIYTGLRLHAYNDKDLERLIWVYGQFVARGVATKLRGEHPTMLERDKAWLVQLVAEKERREQARKDLHDKAPPSSEEDPEVQVSNREGGGVEP